MEILKICWFFLCLVGICSAFPSGSLGIEEDSTEFTEQRNLEENEDETVIDPRLLPSSAPKHSLDPYGCSNHVQCANGGNCVETKKAGKVCNCTVTHIGPFCDYSARSIDQALRVHPVFKVSFAECMTKAGETAGINAVKILSKCGGGQNLCWLNEGGIKGLKCFYWCLTNGMHLSLSEAQPSEESRLQLYAEVFQKLSSERHLPEKQMRPVRPKGVPIYSMEISLYDTSQENYPFPQHNRFGPPQINIKPSVSFWPPNFNPYIPQQPQPFNSPYAPNPPPINPFQYPKSHEIPTPLSPGEEMGPVNENSLQHYISNIPGNLDPYGANEPHMGPKESEQEIFQTTSPLTPGTNFLNDALHDVMMDIYNTNVVESGNGEERNENYNDLMTSEFTPYSDFHSNMRGAPPMGESGSPGFA